MVSSFQTRNIRLITCSYLLQENLKNWGMSFYDHLASPPTISSFSKIQILVDTLLIFKSNFNWKLADKLDLPYFLSQN